MNQLIQLKQTSVLVLVVFGLARLGLSPAVQAVVPPPDGGYPNFTTAEGQNALQDLTSGAGNTAVGAYSLFSTTTGSFNTAVGAGALDLNTGDSNTAVGVAALLLNTGTQNTAVGVDALGLNTAGESNTALGTFALYNNTTGNANTANGSSALFSNTEGNFNTATGFFALHDNTTGSGTTSYGANTLQHNTTGNLNTAVGDNALVSNTTGGNNTATGSNTLFTNTTGSANTAIGAGTLLNTTGSFSTAVGSQALLSNTTGQGTAIGFAALQNNTTGTDNVALGDNAGVNQTTGTGNVYIGSGMAGVAAENDTCYIRSIFNQTSANGIPVLVNAFNKLGITTSSRRFKEEIKPMDEASEALFSLKPVRFRYKKEIDPVGISQLGLVAEDVERVNPDLIVRDKEGKPYSVRYDQVNAMLLNEFLKAHEKIEEQGATITALKSGAAKQEAMIANQQKQIEALTAGLHKVSAQIEANKPAGQTVMN